MSNMRNISELVKIGRKLGETVQNSITKRWDSLELPVILAEIIRSSSGKRTEQLDYFPAQPLVSAQNRYIGAALAEQLHLLLDLHSYLVANEFTESNPLELNCDGLLYSVRDSVVEKPSNLPASLDFGAEPLEITVRAFVLQRQSVQYIIVLNRCYGNWRLDIRQFWDELTPNSYLGSFGEAARRADMSIFDALKISGQLQEFADDVKGVSTPARYSLKAFLDSKLLGGEEDSPRPLRYQDGRDPGYIVSAKLYLEEETFESTAADMHWRGTAELSGVMDTLHSIKASLNEEA